MSDSVSGPTHSVTKYLPHIRYIFLHAQQERANVQMQSGGGPCKSEVRLGCGTWKPHVDYPHHHQHQCPGFRKLHPHHYSKGWRGSLSHYLCAFCGFIASRHALPTQTPTFTAPEELPNCKPRGSQGVQSTRKSADMNSLAQIYRRLNHLVFSYSCSAHLRLVLFTFIYKLPPEQNLQLQISSSVRKRLWGRFQISS